MMADDQQGAAAPGSVQLAVPPTQGSNQFIITATAAEFLVTFGHMRMMPRPDAAGVANPIIEWFLTISMSSTAAKQLADGLQNALQQYETRFGKIPSDPEVKPVLSVGTLGEALTGQQK
jgi:hypothetical protein